MLTGKLKDLENLGLIEKIAAAGSSSANVYSLTQRGETLRPVLNALSAWGEILAAELPVTIG